MAFKNAVHAFRFLGFSLLLGLAGCNSSGSGSGSYPAEEGFHEKESDKKALEIADKMVEAMGGYEAWQKTRFIAWGFYGQYQIWDKKEKLFRHEKDNTVMLLSLAKTQGVVFRNGRRFEDSVTTYGILSNNYVYVVNNIFWLSLPYNMKLRSATIKYAGEGKTQDGRPANLIRMTIDTADINPYKYNKLWIDKETNLLTQWAFYANGDTINPSFIRKWSDYKDYNGIKLATNRDSEMDTLRITDLTVTNKLPKELFLSAKPLDRNKVKEHAGK